MELYEKYVGLVFDNRYRIEKVIGIGGMAIVFKATDLLMRRTVAVKILKGEANVAEMEIGYDPNPVKKYNPELVEALGVTIPDDYVAIEG